MAPKTPGKDRPSAGRRARPSLTERVMAAMLPPLLDTWAEALLTKSRARSGATPARPHWEDAVDMNAAAPPWRRNPSSWSHRIKVAVLAAIGAVLAACMSLYQLHLTASVWDPVFGGGTEQVLTSELSQTIYRIFHAAGRPAGSVGVQHRDPVHSCRFDPALAVPALARRAVWLERPGPGLRRCSVGCGTGAGRQFLVLSVPGHHVDLAAPGSPVGPGGLCIPALLRAGPETLGPLSGRLEYLLGTGLGAGR